MQVKELPRSAYAVVAIFTAAAAILLSVVGREVRLQDWLYITVLVALAILFDLTTLELPFGGVFTFSGTVIFNSHLILGLPAALWIGALSNLLEGVLRRKALWKVLYNASQYTVAMYLSGQLYRLLGGKTGQEFHHAVAALAASVAVMFINGAAMSLMIALMGQATFTGALRHLINGPSGGTYLLSQIAGVVAAYMAIHHAWDMVILMCLMVALLYAALRGHLRQYRQAEIRGHELQAVLDSAPSAIAVWGQDGVLRMANRRFLRWAGLPEGEAGELTPAVRDQILTSSQAQELLRVGALFGSRCEAPSAAGIVAVDLPGVRYLDYRRAPVGTGVGTVEVYTDITALKEAEEQLRAAHTAMLRALTAAIDARDPYTHGHSTRVAEYAVIVARHLGLGEADIRRLHYAALLHDIGKLGVDDRVLRKVGPLTPEERAAMMEHPVIGAQLLEKAGVFLDLLPGVLYHHEWYNGGGYPRGLKGDAIPLDARIIGVADAFDAMTSDRPYRRALTPEEALGRLQAGAGVQFDPQVVAALAEAFAAGELQAVRERYGQPGPAPPSLPDPPPPDVGVILPVHHKELSILYQVARENYTGLTVGEALQRILAICRDAVGLHSYLAFVADPVTGDLVLQATAGAAGVAPGLRLRPGEGVAGQAFAAGRPLVAQDVAGMGRTGLTPGSRSVCAVPMVAGGPPLGVLVVESPLPGAFGRDEVYLFETLSQQMAHVVERVRHHEQLAHAATHDGLTGVLNHRAFYERLTAALEAARATGTPVSILILDLNGLKAVNDTYGHLAGDAALREWATLLLAHARPQDSVARYGGDEFAMILPGLHRHEALELAGRLARAAARTIVVGNTPIPLPQASFGCATFPADGDRATGLVATADRLMYAGKVGDGRRPLHRVTPRAL